MPGWTNAGAQQVGGRVDRPEDKMTSPARNSCSLPSTRALTPIHLRSSNSNSVTWVCVEMCKLSRRRTSAVR